jgi:transcriptional regulator with XRE-family HTH domain
MDPKPLLGGFIRTHRERISPEQAGLPRGLRRRAKGLRREELAALCGISPTWLTWIEQGRAVSLSAGTLARLAGALALTPAERAYLFDLASLRDPEAGAAPADALGAAALQDSLAGAVSKIRSPAYVLDRAWNAIEWNHPAATLFVGWLGRLDPERNLLSYTFLNPQARRFIHDWPERARRLVAEFRADRSASLQEPATRAQVDALRTASADFDRLWRQQDVLDREGGERVFEHPTQGRLIYRQLTLRVAHAPELKLVMLL